MNAQETLEKTPLNDFAWWFWFVVPLYPFSKRQTIRKEVIKDTVWTFDQVQGIFARCRANSHDSCRA